MKNRGEFGESSGRLLHHPYQADIIAVAQRSGLLGNRPAGSQVRRWRAACYSATSFVPLDHPEIWLKQGDPTVYFAPPPT